MITNTRFDLEVLSRFKQTDFEKIEDLLNYYEIYLVNKLYDAKNGFKDYFSLNEIVDKVVLVNNKLDNLIFDYYKTNSFGYREVSTYFNSKPEFALILMKAGFDVVEAFTSIDPSFRNTFCNIGIGCPWKIDLLECGLSLGYKPDFRSKIVYADPVVLAVWSFYDSHISSDDLSRLIEKFWLTDTSFNANNWIFKANEGLFEVDKKKKTQFINIIGDIIKRHDELIILSNATNSISKSNNILKRI